MSTTKTIAHQCDKCEYMAATSYYLKLHRTSKHEGVRYSCDQCENSFLNGLKSHKISKHKGVRYPCDQCDYTSTLTHGLKAHIKKHA